MQIFHQFFFLFLLSTINDPSIYFHWTSTGYKNNNDSNNIVGWSKFSVKKACFSTESLILALNFQCTLHFVCWQLCGPLGRWLDTDISVATAETHYLRLNSVHIHCLVFVSVQQALMNDNGCISPRAGNKWHFFDSYALSCQTPFCQIAICHKTKKTLLTYHQHLLLMSWVNIK